MVRRHDRFFRSPSTVRRCHSAASAWRILRCAAALNHPGVLESSVVENHQLDRRRAQHPAAKDTWLAETVIRLFKTEEIRCGGPWKGLEDVEFATLGWVAWYNDRRLLEPLGYVPPAEFEQTYRDRQPALAELMVLN